MTKFINYTKDRFIDRDLNELVRIEDMLRPYPEEVDLDNISMMHVMLKEEQKNLRGSVENGAFAADLKNPLKEKLYQDTLPSHKQQPLSTNSALNSPKSNASNNNMNAKYKPAGQYLREAADAAGRMAETGAGYEKPFPETKIISTTSITRHEPSTLNASNNLRGHLKKWETYQHTVKDDGSGNPTGGFGHYDPNSKIGDLVGRQKAEHLLTQDIAIAEAGVKRLIGNLHVSQNEYDALVDLYFNVGETKMLQLKNSEDLRKAISEGDHTEMGNELSYSKDNEKISQGLKNRSNSRKDIFNSGIYGKRHE